MALTTDPSQENARQENGNMTIGTLVAEDCRIADVFEKCGIDFCCGGQATLAATCQERDLDLTKILQEIEIIGKEPVGRSENFAAWPLPFLIELHRQHPSWPSLKRMANKLPPMPARLPRCVARITPR